MNLLRLCLGAAVERLEDVRQVDRRDAEPAILHEDLDLAAATRARLAALTRTQGVGPPYLMAFPTRFWSAERSAAGSASTAGRSAGMSRSRVAPASAIAGPETASASSTISAGDTITRWPLARPAWMPANCSTRSTVSPSRRASFWIVLPYCFTRPEFRDDTLRQVVGGGADDGYRCSQLVRHAGHELHLLSRQRLRPPCRDHDQPYAHGHQHEDAEAERQVAPARVAHGRLERTGPVPHQQAPALGFVARARRAVVAGAAAAKQAEEQVPARFAPRWQPQGGHRLPQQAGTARARRRSSPAPRPFRAPGPSRHRALPRRRPVRAPCRSSTATW